MFQKRHPQTGARPGTLLISTDAPAPRIRLVKYSPDGVTDQPVDDVSHLADQVEPGHVTWIDVQGFGDEETLQKIAEQFRIHPLAMEDVVNVPQRPKAEPYPRQLLVITRGVSGHGDSPIERTQLSMIAGPGYLLTFQDRYSNLLDPIRQRIDCPTARLRHNGSDYLVYAILDTIVDAFFPVLATYGERLESLEEAVISNPHPHLLKDVNRLKNELVNLRRTIWPQRDAVRALLADESDLMGDVVHTFLRDTYDHCIQIGEVVEMYREMATGLLNTYMSAVAHRSNEVMKVLTIMSSIFVPMTFVAGVYGMNFERMPELGFAWSYPAVLGIMLATATGMLWFFYRKGWFHVSRLADAGEFEPPRRPADTAAGAGGEARTCILDHDRTATGDRETLTPTPQGQVEPAWRRAG